MLDTRSQVHQVFAELTRYPPEILDVDADLEAELGIDSVKRVEILAVLRERFELPEELEIPREGIKTIADVAGFIEDACKGAVTPAAPADVPAPSAPAHSAPAPAAFTPPVSAAPVYQSPAPAAFTPPTYTAPAPRAPAPRAQASARASNTRVEVLSALRDVIDEALQRLDTQPAASAPSAHVARPNGSTSGHLTNGHAGAHLTNGHLTNGHAGAHLTNGHADGVHLTNGHAPAFRDGLDWAGAPQHVPPSSPARRAVVEGQAMRASAPQPAPSNGHSPAPSWLPEGYKPFEGKVAFVTGSGRGLGHTIAMRLGALGASVVVNSFHSRQRGEATTQALQDMGCDAMHAWGSTAQRGHLERMFGEIEARYGHLDFFVSNASNGIIAKLEDIEETHWERSFGTNVIGLHRGALLARPLMKKRGGGRILCISSPGAQRYIEHFGCQGPVKAAMESLVRYLAVELGPDNIQVNAVSAGPLYGELLGLYPDAQRLVPYWESLVPGGRLGTAEQMAEFICCLLSPSASTINGAVLMADNTGTIRV